MNGFAALFGLMIDFVVGDPEAIPHPVVVIGRCISRLESALSAWGLVPSHAKDTPGLGRNPSSTAQRLGGILLALVIPVGVLAVTQLILRWMAVVSPVLAAAAGAWLISTTIAARGLARAASDVLEPLENGDISRARVMVGRIVGRDTASLDEPEIVRAVVETVAENVVDAITSPLFYAVLGGAPLALWYRSVNTLDSMVGYKNDRYRYFGWASARQDDLANWVPARITGFLIAIAAQVKGLDSQGALRAMFRDAGKHPSPNSGIPEAGFAGALGVRLGGTNYYGGIVSHRAHMGVPLNNLNRRHIKEAVSLMWAVAFLAAALVTVVALTSLVVFLR